jgi:hypothetical protein
LLLEPTTHLFQRIPGCSHLLSPRPLVYQTPPKLTAPLKDVCKATSLKLDKLSP